MTTTIPKLVLNREQVGISVLLAGLLGGCHADPSSTDGDLDTTPPTSSTPFTQPIGTTGLEIQMLPVPPGDNVAGFWMAQQEIDWDVFDAFVFDVDELPVKGSPEAETRPTRPYMLVDRGFGHAGYPAISMSRRGAEAFCHWMNQHAEGTWRLPTRQEWEHACRLGDAPPDEMERYAWYEANADWTTHPVATREADALGFHDMHGNVAEWALDEHGAGVVMGGSFISTIDEITCSSQQPYTKDWNESDPQIPRSIWWLADGPFIGFRIVCESRPRRQGAIQ